ncbi:uncharacterized protein LOC144158419 [Haemaphysalis longicornis]
MMMMAICGEAEAKIRAPHCFEVRTLPRVTDVAVSSFGALPVLLDDGEVITIKDEPLEVSEWSGTVLDSSVEITDGEWLSLSNFSLMEPPDTTTDATDTTDATVVRVDEEGGGAPLVVFPPRFVAATAGLAHLPPEQPARAAMECPVCGSRFQMRCHMVVHMRAAHPSAAATLQLPFSRRDKKMKQLRLSSQLSNSAILRRRRRMVRQAAATLPGLSGSPKKPDQKPAAKPQPKLHPKGLARFQPHGSLGLPPKSENPVRPLSKFKCTKCSFSTNYKVNLVVHRQQAHRRTFRCPQCSYAARDTAQLLQHSRLHAKRGKKGAVPMLKCKWCGSLFGARGALVNHENAHRRAGEPLPGIVKDAPAAESSPAGAAAPAPVAASERPQWRVHECGQCDAVFKYQGSLVRHRLINHPKGKGKVPARKSIATAPTAAPKGEDGGGVFTCECGAQFVQQISLTRHKAAHTRHGTWPAKKESEAPKKVLSAAYALPTASSSSAGDRPSTSKPNGEPCDCDMLSCEACMARLLEDADNLNGGDIEFGSSSLPYMCHICPAEFSTSEELSDHIKEHMEVFP